MRSSLPILALLASAPAALAQQCQLTYHPQPPTYPYGGVGSMTYHAGLHQVIIVDTNGSAQTRIWAWDGAAWSVIATGGPNRREYAAVAYDSARDRLVLFGGDINSSTYLADTWEWDRTGWTQRASTGPSPRSNHGMAYDESRQRTVLFGGYRQPPATTLGDTWEWDGQTWTQAATTGPGPTQVWTSLAYDSLRARTLLYESYPSQLWEWSGTQWLQNPASIPAGSSWMVYDRSRARVVMGGSSGIWDFDPLSGQSTLRQPGSGFEGFAAFDAARSLAVIDAYPRTLEYNGAASGVSAYIAGTPSGGGTFSSGATIVLSIQAGGSNPLTIQWRRDGQPIADGGRISGATTPTLTIMDATVADNGNYDAVVANACATAAPSYPAAVTVNPDCYANCDGSTTPPVLNVNDFSCFLNQFVAGHLYANCDQSWTVPILNVNDFACFLARFAQGCD